MSFPYAWSEWEMPIFFVYEKRKSLESICLLCQHTTEYLNTLGYLLQIGIKSNIVIYGTQVTLVN